MRLSQPQYQLMLQVLANKPRNVPGDQIAMLNELRDLGHIAMNGRQYVVTGRGGCALRASGYSGTLDGVVIQPRITPIRWRGSDYADARAS